MTGTEGQRLVLVGAVGVMGIETLKSAMEGDYNVRLFVGGGIAFTVLAGVSEFAPTFAGMLSMTVLLTVFLSDGGTVMQRLLGTATTVQKGKHK